MEIIRNIESRIGPAKIYKDVIGGVCVQYTVRKKKQWKAGGKMGVL